MSDETCADCDLKFAAARVDHQAYPWDECIADQMKKYGSEETAKKVCGEIKAKYGDANIVVRFDRVSIARDRMIPLPAGGVRVQANIARTGIQEYTRADGSVRREYRPAEEVFAETSLASLGAAPLTRGHPQQGVAPSTWKKDAVGTVSDLPAKRETIDGQDFVVTHVNISDAQAIADVKNGALAELSAGYAVVLDETPGVTPTGEKYDAIQRGVRYNHVALLPPGHARAGRSAKLRLDSGYSIVPEQDMSDTIVKINLDGVEFVEGSKDHLAALASKAAKQEAAHAAALAELQGKLDAATAELATARADAAGVPAAADALLSVRDKYRPLLPKDFVFTGKSKSEILAAACEHVKAEIKTDASDEVREAYLAGRVTRPFDYNERPAVKSDEKPSPTQSFYARLDGAFNRGLEDQTQEKTK